MNLNEKISWLTSDRGLSARALAKKLEVSNSTAAAWLKTARPHPGQIKQLADYFGVTVDELLDDTKELEQVSAEREVARQLGFVQTPTGDFVLGTQAVQDVAWLEAVEKNLQSQRTSLETLINSVSAQLALARGRARKEKTLAVGKKG